ncbi:MAG TPA: hypothetical protein VGS05_04120 [Candidatus Sulfotelmatobacter sp.]|nr:hypothetical protein [Candidatus Sulfotelmatobacter sp.]
MTDPISVTISILALSVSAITAWLTLFRRGTIKITQPTVIYFGPDSVPYVDRRPNPPDPEDFWNC